MQKLYRLFTMSATCGDGQFDFIKCSSTKNAYRDAYQAISRCELWDWLSRFEPGEHGFMYGEKPAELMRIDAIIFSGPISHSGASYGITMRNMQYIAKHGYAKYRTEAIKNHNG